MSDDIVETIELDDTHRIRVEYDLSPENPRTNWDNVTGFINVDNWWNRDSYIKIDSDHDDPTDHIEAAHERLWGLGSDMHVSSYVPKETAIIRWARIFHGIELEYEDGHDMHAGYWFVDPEQFKLNWPDVDPLTTEGRAKQREVIAQDRETYRQWATGEVYGIILEELVHYVRLNETEPTIDYDDTLDEWKEVESLWGLMGYDDFSIAAADNWDLTAYPGFKPADDTII